MTEPIVLITGGSGFAGSHLVEALLKQGVTPHITQRAGGQLPSHLALPADHIHQLDLSEPAAVHQLFTTINPTQLYHLAALAAVGSSFNQMEQVLENNLKLQLVILEELRQSFPQTRTLIIGSSLEYDPINQSNEPLSETHALGPMSPYAVSKVTQDLLALSYFYSYKLPIIRTRPFNHTGEWQTAEFAIPAFAQQIVAIERGRQTSIKVGNLQSVRDIVDVKDVVAAYITLMEKGQVGEVYNIGSGHGYVMQDILNQLSALSQTPVKLETDPERVRPNDVPYLVANISKIQALGWQPTIPIADTLQRVLAYWRNQP